ncbi:MAG TPA: twin-arginine translocation signal domain-containing protein, partial [Actinomycetota bacterium]
MRHPKDISRRQFLARAGTGAIAMPTLAAILAACDKPGESVPPATSGATIGLDNIPIATLDAPVTLPMNAEPIAADTPPESGPLILYNWKDYIYKKEVNAFAEEFGVDVEITTFNNLEEGIQKIAAGG